MKVNQYEIRYILKSDARYVQTTQKYALDPVDLIETMKDYYGDDVKILSIEKIEDQE